ncbi:MAG: helix-turn-helix domain-containing protein [Thiolinea sp.]
MQQKSSDLADLVPFSERVDKTRVPAANDFIIEQHVPSLFDVPYHHHTSIEINFLQDCEMTYSFSGSEASLKPSHLTVFWGAAPHRVTQVMGRGLITNIYLSLGQFVRWGLPTEMVDTLLSGAVISTAANSPLDALLFNRLYAERKLTSTTWKRVHLDEIENRLRRLAVEGWHTILASRNTSKHMEITSQAMMHVEAMLRFIADNFTISITIRDIAESANLSPGRAKPLFKEVLGISIRQHLMRVRLSHARMLLTETDTKIASVALESGFPSLSSFYEAFTKANQTSPAQYRNNAR